MTHIGRRREMNQDYMYTSENAVGKLPNLFLVADGMGGHKAGEYASRFTVEKIVETIETSGQTEPVAAMKEAVEAANRGLLEEAGRDAAKAGMLMPGVGWPICITFWNLIKKPCGLISRFWRWQTKN